MTELKIVKFGREKAKEPIPNLWSWFGGASFGLAPLCFYFAVTAKTVGASIALTIPATFFFFAGFVALACSIIYDDYREKTGKKML